MMLEHTSETKFVGNKDTRTKAYREYPDWMYSIVTAIENNINNIERIAKTWNFSYDITEDGDDTIVVVSREQHSIEQHAKIVVTRKSPENSYSFQFHVVKK